VKESSAMRLRGLLQSPEVIAAPGVFDALSAHIAVEAGFQALFVSGSAVSHTQLARPDIGLISITELASVVERIVDRVDAPVLVDADSGFGNVANVARTVRSLERAGAAAIQIEDQQAVKAADNLTGKPVVSLEEMLTRIKAACDARLHDGTVLSIRTDAAATLGVNEAIDRANAFCEAGADMVFAQSLTSIEDMKRFIDCVDGRAFTLQNIVNPHSAQSQEKEILELDYSIVLYSAIAAEGAAKGLSEALGWLASGSPRETFTIEESVHSIIRENEYIAQFTGDTE
jgi:2-methylisocitrate lyase-like PEP mutase family enzyme